MPKIVNVVGVGNVAFPDDFTEDQMADVLRSNPPVAEGFERPYQEPPPEPVEAGFEAPLTPKEESRLQVPLDYASKTLLDRQAAGPVAAASELAHAAGRGVSELVNVPVRLLHPLAQQLGISKPDAPPPEVHPEVLATPLANMGPAIGEVFGKIGEGVNPIQAIAEVGAFKPETPQSTIGKIYAGVGESVGDLASFFTSPLGIATLGTGALPAIAQRSVAGTFAAQMASATPDIAIELSNEISKPEGQRDPQRIANLVTSAVTTSGFAGAAAGHAARPMPVQPIETAKVVQKGVQSGLERSAVELARVATEPVRAAEAVPTVKESLTVEPVQKVEAVVETPKPTEVPSALPIQEAAGVLRDVPAQSGEVAQEVPVKTSPEGIPQGEQGRVVPETAQAEVAVKPKGLVLWGRKGSDPWIKLSDNVSNAEMTRRQKEGWTVLRHPKGESPAEAPPSPKTEPPLAEPPKAETTKAETTVTQVAKAESVPLGKTDWMAIYESAKDDPKTSQAWKSEALPIMQKLALGFRNFEESQAFTDNKLRPLFKKVGFEPTTRSSLEISKPTTPTPAAPEGGETPSFSPEALQTEPGATLGITPSGLSVPATTIDNLVKKVRQQLSVSGKMPREVHELQTEMESSMRASDFDLRMAERDFMREVSQTYGLGPVARLGGGTRRIPPADVQLMDEYLHGRLTPEQANRIPQNIRGQLDNMRAGIEGWSNKTITTLEEQLSRLDPESAKAKMLNDRIETIRSNMDVYVHRSYKFFNENTPAPDWYANLPAKVRSDAETYVRDNMNLTPAEAQSNLLRWLSDLRDESSFRQGGRVGSKDLTMFLQRKAIPQELRTVLGEYRSPLVNYAKSVSKMSQFVAKQKFLDEVRRKGMGSFLFEEGTEPPGFNARIAPEGSESMSPLSGLRTSQDIADAFKALDQGPKEISNVWDAVVRGWLVTNAWTKFANTAQSLMTHSRNIISRVPMAIQAGHWNVLHVPQAMKLIYQDFAGSNKTWRPFLNRLYKLGVIGDTSRSTELRNILKDAAFQDVAPAELSSWSLMRALKTGLVKIPGDIYRLTDELGNIYGFLNERAIQKRIHPDWTEAKLDAEAATVIRDLYPTYSEAPKIVQTFRKNILVGPFVNFPYQVFRNAVNGVVRSAREIQSENPVERQVGWKRLGSQLLAASTPLAMMELSKQMLGITAQEENDLRRFLPEYDKNSTLIFTGRDPKTGELSYVNASRLVPSTYITDIANPVILAARTGGDLVKAVGDGIKEAFRPFYNEQMLLKATREAYNGVTDTGRKLFNKTDSEWTQTTKRIAHVITALEPGTLQRAQKRIIPALRDEQPRFGRKLEPMREIAREVTGIATEKFNFKTALGFKVRSFVDMSNEAEDHFRRIATGTSKVSEQDVIDAYRESDRRRIAVWQEMRDDYLAAIRRGVSVNEGKSIMRARGMSKADAESIANGRYKPMEVSDQVRKRAKEIGRALPYNATFRESVRTPSKP